MSTQVGLISDPHATPAPLEQALEIFHHKKIEHILCPGDVNGYGDDVARTVSLLQQAGCETVQGNHERWYIEDASPDSDADVLAYFRQLPCSREWHIEGRSLYMVHASPPDSDMEGIRLLDENGQVLEQERQYWDNCLQNFDYDVLVVGHTHQIYAERLGRTLVINPGSTRFNHSCAILTLPEMHVEIVALSGHKPVPSWNWGMIYRQ